MTRRSITVSGTAEIRVAPNLVQLMLAIETADKALAKAKAANDERTSKTLAAMKKFGIEAKDLQTDRITIEARFENGYQNRTEPDAYVVRRAVVVTLREIKRFEELLSVALEAGANRTEGIEFQTTELRKHRDAARAQALKAAREKAIAMAKELDAKVGRPQAIHDTGSSFGMWNWSGSRMGGMQQNAFQGSSGGGSAESEGFAPGQIAVSANVSVTFDLE